MLGMILQVSQKLDQAQAHYERALNIDPMAAVAANNLAWIYTETGGSLDTALQLAQTAKLHLPDLPSRRHARMGLLQEGNVHAGGAAAGRDVRRSPQKAVYPVPPRNGIREARKQREGARLPATGAGTRPDVRRGGRRTKTPVDPFNPKARS
jgi:tetratricopeptide (TPR) repeat protein